MSTRERLYGQIWKDVDRLKSLMDRADAGDIDARRKFVRIHGALDVRRIFADSLEWDAEGLEEMDSDEPEDEIPL